MILNRFPSASWLGHIVRAMVSFTITTGGRPAVSGGLGFRALLYVGAMDLRPLLAHLEALGLRPIRP